MNERYNMPTAARRGEGPIAGAVAAWRANGRDPASRDRLVDAWVEVEIGRQSSIAGGTSEIMRNILGERVLGLPPEPRLDKDVPWREVPRS